MPTPTPKAGAVLVRVHAASVNDWDLAMLQGAPLVVRMFNGVLSPNVRIIGCDIAGRVEAVGRDVKAFQPGDEVYLTEDFTRNGKSYDLILNVKTNRSPFAYARALAPGGSYVTVSGSTPRLLQALALRSAMSRVCHKRMGMVVLKRGVRSAPFWRSDD